MSKIIQHYSEAEARDFFERFAAYSAEYVRVAIPAISANFPSRNYYAQEFPDGKPIGHVAHWTGGTSFSGTISHFCNNRVASAHWVIAKALDRRFDELRTQLDLNGDLRAEAVQCVAPVYPAWSAGWVNRLLHSTELRNAGLLRAFPKGKKPTHDSPTMGEFFKYGDVDVDELDFYWWPAGWTQPFKGEVLLVKTPHGGAWFESFSRGQISTMITTARYASSLYPGCYDPVWMLAHHQVCNAKMDIVLPLDIHGIRDAVLYSKEHVDDIDWLSELDDVEDGFELEDDPWMMRELTQRQSDRAEEDLADFRLEQITGRIDSKGEVKEALRRLGYHVGTDADVIRSLRIYQQGYELGVDGVAGDMTMTSLERTLKKWRLM